MRSEIYENQSSMSNVTCTNYFTIFLQNVNMANLLLVFI